MHAAVRCVLKKEAGFLKESKLFGVPLTKVGTLKDYVHTFAMPANFFDDEMERRTSYNPDLYFYIVEVHVED